MTEAILPDTGKQKVVMAGNITERVSDYGHFPTIGLKSWVPRSEHLIQPVQLVLQGAPDLHSEERTRVVHDVHRCAVQQSPNRLVHSFSHCAV